MGVTILVDELTLILPSTHYSMPTPCVCCWALGSLCVPNLALAVELSTCYSTRENFWSAELKWILKMKVTNGLL